MGKKRKSNIVRCEICGVEATQYVHDTDCAVCDNPVCFNEMAHQIEVAVKQYKQQEEWERGVYV